MAYGLKASSCDPLILDCLWDYAENNSMKDLCDHEVINTRFIVIVNHHMYHMFDKMNSDMCSYVIFVLRRFWMSTFSNDASEKYCFCEATVDSAQYCKMWELWKLLQALYIFKNRM